MSLSHPRSPSPQVQAEERMSMGGGLNPAVPSTPAGLPTPQKWGVPFPLPHCLLYHCLLGNLGARQGSTHENTCSGPCASLCT